MASSGLPREVEALIWTWSSAKPYWMPPDDYVHLDNLRQKMKPFMEVKKELENWRPEKEEDDNVFRIHIENIERKASSIQEKLTKARSELSQACSNNFLGGKFSTSIEKFCEASQQNTVS